jgi:hypothetical protein
MSAAESANLLIIYPIPRELNTRIWKHGSRVLPLMHLLRRHTVQVWQAKLDNQDRESSTRRPL